MQFLKAFSIFFLLVLGNTGTAFSLSVEDTTADNQQEISLQLSEDISELYDSTLGGYDAINFRLSPPLVQDFYFQSTFIADQADRYVNLSRLIDPALDVKEIIFPFHFFL